MAWPVSATAAVGPVKLVPAGQMGWQVDKTTKANVCTVASKDECQQAHPSGEPQGFEYPEGVAGATNGDIYVTDRGNRRVQELTADGQFVLMFGKGVNATTHGDICTEIEIKESAVKCQAGAPGGGSDALAQVQSIVTDPNTGMVYVQDLTNWRVDKYSPEGQFVLMIGKEVNETKDKIPGATTEERNVCTAASGDICKAGVHDLAEGGEKGAFNFAEGPGNLLAVGASDKLIYVGDATRVQVFDATGEAKEDITLPAAVVASAPGGRITGLAVAGEIVYVSFQFGNVVHEFNTVTGKELTESLVVSPNQAGNKVEVRTVTADATGHLAITANEQIGNISHQFGLLYTVPDNRLMTGFNVVGDVGLHGVKGIGFNGDGQLYTAIRENHELASYEPKPVAELVSKAAICSPGVEIDTSGTFDCTLNGEINAYGVDGTEAWFEWGRTCSFGLETGKQSIEPVEVVLPVSGAVNELRPNETFCFQLVGTDENLAASDRLKSSAVVFKTASVPPRIVGTPSVSFVKASSAVMYGEINPENAPTEYFFEYAPAPGSGGPGLAACPGVQQAACAGVLSTTGLESSLYGAMGATQEASGLQPSTTYDYRLAEVGAEDQTTLGPEAEFTTLAAEKENVPAPPEHVVTEFAVLLPPVSLAMLPVPKISFPKIGPHCKRGYRRNTHGKCVRSKIKARGKRNVSKKK
jgi:hypothetical protein